MVQILNKLNQRIAVNLPGGKNLELLAKGTAQVSEKELNTPHLQTLVIKGDIVVLAANREKSSQNTKKEHPRKANDPA